jgi:Fe-S oxidoreductase
MCPIFHVTKNEAASPRAKANLLRHILSGGNGNHLGANDVRAVADLCVNCKMCSHECPAHVNVPKLMLEAKAAHHAEHGLDRPDWITARTEAIATLGSNFALTSNTLLSNRIFRWLLERFFGVSRHRQLSEFASRSFLKRAKRRGLNRKRRAPIGGSRFPAVAFEKTWDVKAAYFVDIFPNHFDPLIAEATVAVFKHHGVDLHVPLDQKGSGMDPLSVGDVELAREMVAHNLRIFAELAREGYVIVCSEPTAALLFRQDALDLIDDSDVKLVADQTVELTAFLWQMHEKSLLRTDFQPLDLSLGHHVPCHVKALGLGIHGPELLSLIPQLKVQTIDVSCSGMAGTFGLKAKNFAASLAAGRPMLEELARPRVLFGSTECGTCRMQMEHGSGKRTLHPVQYLALAYGLMPEIGRKLRVPVGGKRN